MACKCYPPMTRATGVSVSGGITTITVPESTELVSGNVYNIVLATAIPDGTDGTQVNISAGSKSASIMQENGNYFRPLPLKSRTVLVVQYFDDPAHFQIIKVRCSCRCRS